MTWTLGYGGRSGLAVPDPPAPDWTTLLNVDFDTASLGAMTGTKMRNLFNDASQPSTYPGYSRMVLVDDGTRGRVCRLDFTVGRGNGTSPEEIIAMFPVLDFSGYPGGYAAVLNKPVRMTDWIKYPTTWMFPPAMKTPGLGANINGASDGQASGGNGLDAGMVNALSCRIMNYSAIDGNWSAGVPGSSSSLLNRNNRLAMYSYYEGMASSFGKDLWNPDPGAPGHWPSTRSGSPARAFGDNLWHKRELVLVPNTKVGGTYQADGKIRYYFDGTLIHKYDNLPWRSIDGLWINKFWWHHFLGGSGDAYASPQTQSYYYDGPIVEFANFTGWTVD